MLQSSPLVGYAEEPLLPLSKACVPLINIINNLLDYVQLALSETPQEPPDGLTVDESAAIRLYTMHGEGYIKVSIRSSIMLSRKPIATIFDLISSI